MKSTYALTTLPRRPRNRSKKEFQERIGTNVDKQQLNWLECVRDYSDGVRGYGGGYAIAGPGLHHIDQQLRGLGYVAGAPNRAFASVVADTGRAAWLRSTALNILRPAAQDDRGGSARGVRVISTDQNDRLHGII